MTGPNLRDIHLPPEPGAWPPASGWWVLAALGALLALWMLRLVGRLWRRARRRRELLAEFDRQLAVAVDPASELAAMSSLLRRAASTQTAGNATLAGEAWLRFLDGADPDRPFSAGPGRVLVEGLYRVEPGASLAPLRALVRRRFLGLMGAADA